MSSRINKLSFYLKLSKNNVIYPLEVPDVNNSILAKILRIYNFLKENDGKPFNEDEVRRMANSLGLELLGAGLYRIAIELNDDLIVKIAYNDMGVDMNKREFENYNLFVDNFPRIYGHGSSREGDGYDWLIMEKVNVIDKENKSLLLNWFPEIKDIKDYFDNEYPEYLYDEFDILAESFERCNQELPGNEDIFKKLFNNDTFKDLCGAIAASETAAGDLLAGNLGYKGERFLILDIDL